MSIIKKIILFPLLVVKTILKGLLFLSLLLSRGFYFYIVLFFKMLKKITTLKVFDKAIIHFEKRKEQPEFVLILILWCVAFIALFNILYVHDDQVVSLDGNVVKEELREDKEEVSSEDKSADGFYSTVVTDMNPFRVYGKLSLNEVDFTTLKKVNPDTVAWLSVDRTNINYPIVKTSNNDFYLDHTFDRSFKKPGWTFMDYRNNPNMSDTNTIFYGHNLLNKTSFGSISNIFSDDWAKSSNRTIIVKTESKTYYYEIFSAYYIEPEVYYLQTNFNSADERIKFLNTLKKRNIININVDVGSMDSIITLSTCSDDNKGRKVVHAKLINVQ